MSKPLPPLVQDYALTVDRFLDHGAKWHRHARVATASGDGDRTAEYAAVRERANRLSGALAALGLEAGDRVATLAWNTQSHLEVWYGVMGAGLVCHTLNPRLTLERLDEMTREAGDRVLFADAGFADTARALQTACPALEHVFLLDGEGNDGGAGLQTYDGLLGRLGRTAEWGRVDERALAGLCYTSGTTGAPKGVGYTHRSNYLHAIRSLQADAFALTAADVVLAAVPMFHANAWGLPFAAPAAGASLVLPGRALDGASLARLIARHGVTVAVGVPTVWIGLLDHLDATGGDIPTLKRIIVGGSSCPDALVRRIEERLGVSVQTSWGMTELSPLGVISPPGAAPDASAGRPLMGLDLLLVDENDRPLPEQRGVEGRLKVRGHSVANRYLGETRAATDADGWFDTGDLAIIDEAGTLTLAGRAKDLIKSGGEWINPVEIEEIVGALPDVALVAVIGRADPRWGERPVMVVEPAQGRSLDDGDLRAALRGRVADWWIPDRIVSVGQMPLAATGKIDKTELRALYGGV